MGDRDVMMAVRSGVIRREGQTLLVVRKGVTTAHAGADVVRDHPHLWSRLEVTFPVGDEVTDAAADARLSHTQALRDLYAGLVERGFELPEGTPADDVAAAVVDLALRAIDAAGGGDLLVELGGGAPVPAPSEDTHAVVDPGTKEGRAEIRAWARAQDDENLRVSDSGPIPQHVIDAWAAAQGGRA